MTVVKAKACGQDNCPVGRSGECLESLELEECPHFYWAQPSEYELTAEERTQEDISVIPSHSNARTQLFSGNELMLEEISAVTSKYPCDLVVILGDLGSGKTTLLGTIFDLFQLGHFTDMIFGASLTQKGFEVRSHLSRVISGRDTSDTERTKTLEFRVLHLGVRVEGRSHIQHLLLSDVSGETIRQARLSSAFMKKQLKIAKDADHLFYILDGEKLDFRNRVKTLLNAELFIQSAINNGIFSSSTVLNILITKWDKVKDEEGFNVEQIKEQFNNKFGASLQAIHYSQMASRPDEQVQELDMGYGVSEFLNRLLVTKPKQSPVCATESASERFFDKFKVMEGNG